MRLGIVMMATLTLLLVAAACGSGDSSGGDDVLTLRGGDLTESEFILDIRVILAEPGAEAFCNSLRGLSDREAADLFKAFSDNDPSFDAVQEPDPDDEERGAAIVKKECDRLF